MNNLPNEFINRIKNQLSNEEFNKFLDSYDNEPKSGLIFNMSKTNDELINQIINEYNLIKLYSSCNYDYYSYDKNKLIDNNIYPGKSIYYHQGLYYIQEPSAAKVLSNVKFNKNDKILDMCASPGGKSIDILANNLIDEGFIVSNEIDIDRAKILSKNFERLGFDNYIITSNSANELYNCFNEYFDKIILDAPCSGEGMMRKNSIAIEQWSINLIQKMSSIQKELIDYAYKMLKPNGILIYSTCTYAKEEDEEIIEYITSKYNNIKIFEMNKIYPQDNIGEGQFYCILQKNDSIDKVNHESNNNNYINKFEPYNINQIDKKSLNTIKETIDIKFLNNPNINIIKFKNSIYLINNHIPINLFINLRIIRFGIEFLLIKDNRIEISHSFTHSKYYDSFINKYELDYDNCNKYLKGDSIKIEENINCNAIICYKNNPLGLAKINNKTIKNHYPKGLRNF